MPKKKNIGVKMSVGGKNIPIGSPVFSKYDVDGNLVLTFEMRDRNRTKVEMVFDKREYLDIEDE